jgi:hypothetical protein
MTFSFDRRLLASATAAAALLAVSLASSGAARAWSEDIIRNCTEDYFAYCKEHSPESAELRYCMEAHRTKISKQCVKALVDAGEVPKKYLANVPQSQPKK